MEDRTLPKYLALDPGHSTGWATFDDNGDLVTMGTAKRRTEVYDLLRTSEAEVIIMEDWISKEKVSFGGDKMETVRIIGAVELYCHLNDVKLYEQPNHIKGIAYLWAGIPKPKAKVLSHETDAYVHGVYWLQKAGIRKPQQGKVTK